MEGWRPDGARVPCVAIVLEFECVLGASWGVKKSEGKEERISSVEMIEFGWRVWVV